ncbi:hypothetical protein TorRG33x02_042550 [Trema orientale]|uniref:Uncharacterized protein n=1 Tax=Trema orientale TaxID=63057 RepID=A0A2P5FPU7_TREOI|nr:hypothetical protein TorRG33x02_042550 [Trema orientale]
MRRLSFSVVEQRRHTVAPACRCAAQKPPPLADNDAPPATASARAAQPCENTVEAAVVAALFGDFSSKFPLSAAVEGQGLLSKANR